MKIRVFLRSQNPAIDPPSSHQKESAFTDQQFIREFRAAKPGAIFSRGRAMKIDHRSLQLLARGPSEPDHVAKFPNWSGGDPAFWAIVGQTTRDSLLPGCPTFQMITTGRAGINAE
jgi:hypothetical protein